jgi:hypothetical protein
METQKTDDQNEKRGGEKKKPIGTIILIAVIAVLIGVIVFLVMKRDGDEKRDVVNPIVTEDNLEETIQQMEEQEYVEPGYYTVTQNYEWHFDKWDSPSTDAHVENVPENTNDVYFDVFLASDEDREDPIYESPVIPRGSSLEGITLEKELEDGTYDCVVEYHLVDEEQNSLGTVSMTTTVVIGN